MRFHVGVESKFWTKIFFSKNFFYILFNFCRRELKSREFVNLWIFFPNFLPLFSILWMSCTFKYFRSRFLPFFKYSQTPKIIPLFSHFFYRVKFLINTDDFTEWLYLCDILSFYPIFQIFTNAQNCPTFFPLFCKAKFLINNDHFIDWLYLCGILVLKT